MKQIIQGFRDKMRREKKRVLLLGALIFVAIILALGVSTVLDTDVVYPLLLCADYFCCTLVSALGFLY